MNFDEQTFNGMLNHSVNRLGAVNMRCSTLGFVTCAGRSQHAVPTWRNAVTWRDAVQTSDAQWWCEAVRRGRKTVHHVTVWCRGLLHPPSSSNPVISKVFYQPWLRWATPARHPCQQRATSILVCLLKRLKPPHFILTGGAEGLLMIHVSWERNRILWQTGWYPNNTLDWPFLQIEKNPISK